MNNTSNSFAVGEQLDATLQACIDACNRTMQACNECFDACCALPGQDRAACIKALRDCADVCSLVAQFISRRSVNARLFCSICANLCEACAAACAKFADPSCQNCAEICRNCATACREACCS